jgi:hypothetical protein
MKKNFSSIFLLFSVFGLSLAIVSCSETNTPVDPTAKGSITIEFDNVAGNQDLVLNTGTYKNSTGESFSVSKLDYFVSNIMLSRADGSTYTVPKDSSYFLIIESNAESQEVTLNNVPVGEYTGLQFIVGVDSLKSVSDISQRKGVLDTGSGPTNDEAMYWDWNPGYIFLKLEGTSAVSTSSNGKFYYHIGGFGGRTSKTLNNIRTVKVDFAGKKAVVTKELHPEVHLLADVIKVFDGPTKVSIQANSSVMFMDYSKYIADNYVNMFTLDHIHAD